MLVEEKKSKILSLEQFIIIFFLFLGAMNFVTRYYYWFFIAFFLFLLFITRIKFDFPLCALLILAFSFLLFGVGYMNSFTNVLKPFIYPICYLMGRGFFKGFKNRKEMGRSETAITTILVVMALGLFVHLLLNFFTNLESQDRNTVDFWVGETISATGQTALACLPIAVIFAVLFSERKSWQKLLALITLLLILFYNLILAGRTIFFFTIILFLVAGCYMMFGIKREKSKAKQKIAIMLLLCFTLLYLLYSYNVFNIKNIIIESNFYNRFFGKDSSDMTSDPRGDLKILYIKNMWGNFWGGDKIRNIIGQYAHDLYLDTYDHAGVFAFVSVVIYVFISFKNFWGCVTDKTIEFKFRQLILCIYIISYIEFMIEPILIGMQWYFAIFCFFDGMVRSHLYSKRNLSYTIGETGREE